MKQFELSDEAMEWLKNGEQGISSKAIFQITTGLPMLNGPFSNISYSNPSDPSDFRRCRLLLEAVPECRKKFKEMRFVSPQWDGLIEHWDELCKLMDEECQNWKEPKGNEVCQKTYDKMHKIIEKARKEQPTWIPNFTIVSYSEEKQEDK
jgi:hypothetical protein